MLWTKQHGLYCLYGEDIFCFCVVSIKSTKLFLYKTNAFVMLVSFQLRDKIRKKELKNAWKYPNIRLFTVDHHISDYPANDIEVMHQWSIPKKGD